MKRKKLNNKVNLERLDRRLESLEDLMEEDLMEDFGIRRMRFGDTDFRRRMLP